MIKLNSYKVLILLIPCFYICCSHKQSPVKLPLLKESNLNINNIKFRLDTVEKYKPISRNSILTTDLNGNVKIYSISQGYLVTLNNTEWKTIHNFIPFNGGSLKTNIIHSNLISDSLIYFLYEQVLWKFNTITFEYTKIEDLNLKIKSNKGTLYHNWQDCYNQSPSIVYNKVLNTLYYPIFSYSKKDNKFFIGTYNLNNKKIGILNLERPNVDEMIQRSVQDNTMYIIDSNKMYFAFGFNKLGLVYNFNNGNLDSINLQSKYDTIPQIAYTEKNTGIKSSSDRLMKTIIYNARYNFLSYNPFKKHYYKIFNKNLEEDNKTNGLKNTLDEKEVVLQIYDNKLQLIKEIELPKSFHYISMMTINKNGLSLFEPTDANFVKYNPNKMQMLTISYE